MIYEANNLEVNYEVVKHEERTGFPSMNILIDKIKELNPKATDIVIMSICEITKEEMEIFLS